MAKQIKPQTPIAFTKTPNGRGTKFVILAF
jgi:hypothetical protein